MSKNTITKKRVLYPISITIFTVFSTTIAILVCGIIIINYRQGAESAYNTAEQMMQKNSDQVFMKIETLYEPILNITNQSSELPILGEKPTLQNHPAENYLLNSMDAYPQIQNLFMGYSDGDFYEILSCKGDLEESIKVSLQAPEGTRYAILRQFSIEGRDKPVRIWKYINSLRQTIGSRVEETTDYDPRIRPWYINAQDIRGSVKTDPYFFANLEQMGITISHTIDGDTHGVVGADILMEDIYSYLEKLKAGTQEEIVIFNSSFNITSNIEGSTPMEDSESVIVKYFREYIKGKKLEDEMELTLKVEGETYLIKITALPDRYGNNEYLFISVPRKEIMGTIIQETRFTSLISLCLLLLSLPLILLISRQISAPINKLVVEANKIAAFDLDGNIDINTRIKETQLLTIEMDAMKRGLSMFNKYVPSQLVKQLMQSNEELEIGGSEKEMTIMFTDIAEFTRISENCSPQDLMIRLSEYFNLLSTIIRKNNGTVDKYIGDAIMAFWNAPIDDINHVENSCYSAIEMQKELHGFNRLLIEKGVEPFNTRIGINTGSAVVGNMGSSDRMNYTAIGDIVNSSSRLEGVNKYYNSNIIIGEKVAKHLGPDFVFRPMDKVIVKGKTEPEVIYELVGLYKDLPKDVIDFAIYSTEGFYNFYNRNWEEAKELFTKAQQLNDQNIQVNRYIKDCNKHILKSPDEKWNGVIVLKVK